MTDAKGGNLQFQVIGCGSGMPHPKLACSSYLVRHGERELLFDAGEGLSSALRRLEIDPREIGTIFISHFHSDHWAGLPLFLQFNYLLERKERLDVFVPPEGLTFVRRLLDQIYLFPDKLPFTLEFHRITKSLVFEMRDLTVRPWPNGHLQHQAAYISGKRIPNKLQSYSYVIESEGRSVVYSSDIRDIDDLLPVLPRTSLLVLEGNHIDLDKLPAIAGVNEIEKILLTHLPEDFNLDSVRKKFKIVKNSTLCEAKEGLTINV